ncbi:aldolase/citrate lyase family protein [Polaromonas sp.]|uniref:HpcH/HpaI aldolase family protein n=1 Tax=Polaromonas sp. TaxID=1869339 RepID=UPI00182D0B59|nr:aldolase/citrate lyase family protein [Polaromonas sp.]NMM05933.1 aldolase [Polaromonas sp.]
MISSSFRQAVRARNRLAGTFVKTASHQTVEVLGTSGLDFIVIDAEHAPFSQNALDICLLAARATQLPALVRIADSQPATILQALDMGATGLLVPHAKTVAGIQAVLACTRYRGGSRGFSNSSRAGQYGLTPMLPLVDAADRDVAVVFQIEDREAVEAIETLAALKEVDGFLIGRADLAVSYGVFDPAHPEVYAATVRICQACVALKRPVGMFLANLSELDEWIQRGVSFFVIGSDQAYLRAGASATASQVRSA